MVYGYCRVSTKGQLDGNSIEDQENSIKQRYPDAKIIIEASSGAKEREIFGDLFKSLQPNDTLVCTKLDRFCRTVKEGLEYIDGLCPGG